MLVSICEMCGNEFEAYQSAARRFCSRDCAYKSSPSKRHGESKSRLHGIWCHMKTRCLCPTVKAFAYYGARGISVCNEWSESFEAFRSWALANGYRDDLELDRKDTNGDYEPNNCRWATRVQQMQNTRKRCNAKTSRFKGVSWCANVGRWRVQLHQNKRPIHIGLFDDEIEAAKAYDHAARRLYGEFAMTNFQQGGVPS